MFKAEPLEKKAAYYSIKDASFRLKTDKEDPEKEECDWIMLNRADEATLKKYSRAENLVAKRDRLNKKYGPWRG